MTRHIGLVGLALIKRFEGCKLAAYRCPAGIWNIGYGSTGKEVRPGLAITEAQADQLLTQDLARFETAVDQAAPNAGRSEFDAMVALAFNIGVAAFSRSTLISKHKAGDHAAARAEFARWNKIGGKPSPGLTRRRAAEADLYAQGR